jgi:hypothetical protein
LAIGEGAAAALFFVRYGAACHSYHVETTVENRTGGAIQLLEVDYPSASFGANSLAAGAVLPYRIQLRGSGPLKVQYTGSDGRKTQVEGPMLAEQQEGRIEIVLLPEGKAEFHPELYPKVIGINLWPCRLPACSSTSAS